MKIFVAAWAIVGVLLTGVAATAQSAKPTIVLVHGAFADSSSWYGVISILETVIRSSPQPIRCVA